MEKPTEYGNIKWLSEEEYLKCVGQLRLHMANVFTPFNKYGLGDYIPNAVIEAVKLCEDFGLIVRGVDKPISIERIRTKNIKRLGETK